MRIQALILCSVTVSLSTSLAHAAWKLARFPSAPGDASANQCLIRGTSQNGDPLDLNVRQLALLLRRSPSVAKIIESAYGVPDAKLFLLEQALTGGEEDRCQPDTLLPVVKGNDPSCTSLIKSLNENEIPFEKKKFNLEFSSGKITQSNGQSGNQGKQNTAQ